MSPVRDLLGRWRRDGAGNRVLLIAREVTDRRRSVQAALAEIRQAMQATTPPPEAPPLELPTLPALPDWLFL